jgi:hypothetical protein
MRQPAGVEDAVSSTLEWVGAQVIKIGRAQFGEVALPNADWSRGVNFRVLSKRRSNNPSLKRPGNPVAPE